MLLIVGFVYWTAGLIPAAIAALALVLTYQEMPEFIWLWGNLLAALAIARAAPEGRFRKFASGYRTVSFVVLGIALLPFLWLQIRFALYPQLAPSERSYGIMANVARSEVRDGAGRRLCRGCRCRCLPCGRPLTLAAAAPTETDVITAEDIGKFPDTNVRESLQRVPSVPRSKRRLNSRAGGAAICRRHRAAGRPRHSRLGIQLL